MWHGQCENASRLQHAGAVKKNFKVVERNVDPLESTPCLVFATLKQGHSRQSNV
jgi:hypothetical protein